MRLRKNFHQAKWDEPVIFELSTKGERGIIPPKIEKKIEEIVGDGISVIPKNLVRREAPFLPEISQMRVLKHYLRLSQENLGADLNVDIGQGTCCVKYSPKINEIFATSPKFTELHPNQDECTLQGILEIIHKMDLFLREISGLDKFTFQPGGGSQAILAMVSIIQKYHDLSGESDQRDEIITTIFSHPSDAAAAAVKGYKIITLYPNEEGLPDIKALRTAVSNRTAGLLITNPEDTGIFNPDIAQFTNLVRDHGGLSGYDQANANGLLGIARAKEAGFDMCFFNLHKTFSSPHGCGGPATGALGVSEDLIDFLPIPLVDFNGKNYFFNYNIQHTIGKVRGYYGVIPTVLRSYAWIRSLGAEGLKEVSRIAVLNNNYLLKKVLEIRGASAPYAIGKHRIEQVRYSWEDLTNDTGITTEDITNRMIDFGFHMWSSHHPFIVPQPMTLEPTESYSKSEIDEYIAGLKRVVEEAYTNPDIVKKAPHNSVVHKIKTDSLDDPAKWAITWRAYIKKSINSEN
ncbi:MAG: aminomethyl-transferring glycine dehydrogenase subunit GcvPB [Candidatus Hodarchaeales archaeon]|jgi:glycine dehydrogenase subunit 2